MVGTSWNNSERTDCFTDAVAWRSLAYTDSSPPA